MNQRDIDTHTAVLVLFASTEGEQGDRLLSALEQAYAAALASVEANLAHASLPGLRERQSELLALYERGVLRETRTLARGTWLLVLSHLDEESQRQLQRTYEDLQRGGGAALEYGQPTEGTAEGVLWGLDSAEDLLVALPHTTLAPSAGPDDHDQRRGTLTIEVEWPLQRSVDPDVSLPVRVVWRDGYESQVATMNLLLYADTASWQLEIADPVPGRTAERSTPQLHVDPVEAAHIGLPDAIAWANDELADYTIVPWSEGAGPS